MQKWLIEQSAPYTRKVIYYGEDATLRSDIEDMESKIIRFSRKHGYTSKAMANTVAQIIRQETIHDGCQVMVMATEM